jgi:hypothetical protein
MSTFLPSRHDHAHPLSHRTAPARTHEQEPALSHPAVQKTNYASGTNLNQKPITRADRAVRVRSVLPAFSRSVTIRD